MKHICITFLLTSLVFLTSCANSPHSKGQQGAVGGAAYGALVGQMIGHNTEATLIGMAVGTLLGYIVGNEMDKYDAQQFQNTFETYPSYQTAQWVNPDTNNQYSVTPEPAYTSNNGATAGRVCRDAEVEGYVNGQREYIRTTACRRPDGTWEM